ncbi:hypothetical protein JTE88_05410 [Arcanobacterium phocisimile]|uniref:Uncharacterized protein n=1 Tax=Arcanobacterium phocisimile TaxID=1302235 RepID=A0ABX7IEI4_9ACTO|nr:hypothetical protein [Arcanobacterium phocisimile]QRV01549.1 hypothetical protein JTE88_05410 [Arcanobacterium phocisimile]
MSDEKRLSRRQLKKMGKLGVRPADGIDISETTELHLRRPSRKELREARKAETGTLAAVSAEISEHETAESALATSADEQRTESVKPERTSVFSRFKVTKPEESQVSAEDVVEEQTGVEENVQESTSGDTVADNVEETSGTIEKHDALIGYAQEQGSSVETQEEREHTNDEQAVEPDECEESGAANSEADDTMDTPMRDRLLSLTRRQSVDDETNVEQSSEIARTSVMPEGSDIEAEELGQLTSPDHTPESSQEIHEPAVSATSRGSMSYYEEDELDDEISTKRTILNYVLLLLIASLVGVLVGLGITSVFFSADPITTFTDQTTELLL